MSSSAKKKARREAWAAEQIATATSFTAVMFLGYPEGHDRREAASLDEARAHRQRMLAEYEGKNYGRGVMIYALTPNGMSVHVE